MDQRRFDLPRFYHWALPPLWIFSFAVGRLLSPERILEILKFAPMRCPLNFFLGISCPTCGLGRSLAMAFSGNYFESWHFHPLGLLLYFFSFVFFGIRIFNRRALKH